MYLFNENLSYSLLKVRHFNFDLRTLLSVIPLVLVDRKPPKSFNNYERVRWRRENYGVTDIVRQRSSTRVQLLFSKSRVFSFIFGSYKIYKHNWFVYLLSYIDIETSKCYAFINITLNFRNVTKKQHKIKKGKKSGKTYLMWFWMMMFTMMICTNVCTIRYITTHCICYDKTNKYK